MSAILELFRFGKKKINNNLSVFVKTTDGNSLSVDLDFQWDIQKLKDIIAPQLGKKKTRQHLKVAKIDQLFIYRNAT